MDKLANCGISGVKTSDSVSISVSVLFIKWHTHTQKVLVLACCLYNDTPTLRKYKYNNVAIGRGWSDIPRTFIQPFLIREGKVSTKSFLTAWVIPFFSSRFLWHAVAMGYFV
jgi:hypothetical protein